MKEQARINVKERLTKALEKYTLEEIAEAYGCEVANFTVLIKKIDKNDKNVHWSTYVKVGRALDKLEGK